jgi:hypothetical protein
MVSQSPILTYTCFQISPTGVLQREKVRLVIMILLALIPHTETEISVRPASKVIVPPAANTLIDRSMRSKRKVRRGPSSDLLPMVSNVGSIYITGRPVTQCDHCRELRKTKQVHVRCQCGSREDPTSPISPSSALFFITANALTILSRTYKWTAGTNFP